MKGALALYGFLNLSRKNLADRNLPELRHQSINNILARALELGKTPKWPVAG
jgi:hypothetical protein